MSIFLAFGFKFRISGQQTMLSHIQTGDFFFGTDPQTYGLFDDKEHGDDDDCHISRNTHYTKGLNTQEVEAAAVEYTLFDGNTCGEETGKDGTQSTANTVNGYGTDRIVNLGNPSLQPQ